jgi:hypothetical protein
MDFEPGDDVGYQNVAYLRENGPAPAADLPTEVATRHRAVGVYSFTIQGGSGSDGISLPGSLRKVYYLDEHSPSDVITVFLETNDGLLEEATTKGLVRRFGGHGAEWRDAARTVLREEFDLLSSDPTPESRGEPQRVKCWRCDEYVVDLETHLVAECPESDS